VRTGQLVERLDTSARLATPHRYHELKIRLNSNK
jgi:hypothetical protein